MNKNNRYKTKWFIYLACVLLLLTTAGCTSASAADVEETEVSAVETPAEKATPRPSPSPTPDSAEKAVGVQHDAIELTVAAGAELIEMVQTMANVFMQYEYGAKITVVAAESGEDTDADIDVMLCVADNEDEIINGRYKELLCVGGIAVIVNTQSEVEDLTIEQVRSLYTSEVTDWAQLGAQAGAINCYTLDSESYLHKGFERVIGVTLEGESSEIYRTSGYDPCLLGVSFDAQGVGYTQPERVQYYEDVKAVCINGIAPTEDNVRSGEYALSNSVYILTDGEPEGDAAAFIDFCLNDTAAHIIIENQAFILPE